MTATYFSSMITQAQKQAWSRSLASSIRGKSVTLLAIDEWAGNDPFNGQTHVEEFEMRKTGNKEYGFFLRNKYHRRAVARYKCSHLEAKRRFTLLLITKRLRS